LEGKTNAIKIGVLMVWHEQDGRWTLLARQAYRIEQARNWTFLSSLREQRGGAD
jgi:hypothetical protein